MNIHAHAGKVSTTKEVEALRMEAMAVGMEGQLAFLKEDEVSVVCV